MTVGCTVGTLYDAGNGYVQNNRRNIFNLMVEKGFASSAEEAEAIWQPLFKEHNQSYKALRVGGGFDIDKHEFWSAHRQGAEVSFGYCLLFIVIICSWCCRC